MLEVIDQYGAHHRFDDSYVVHDDEGDTLVIAKESDEGYYDIVATFPHPAAYGEVGSFDQLSLREAPPGVVRRMNDMEKKIAEAENIKNVSDEAYRKLMADFAASEARWKNWKSPDKRTMSRETRAMLLNVLWHHQGGSSNVGQPIRAILGIGEHDHLTDEQLAEAKWIDGLLSRSTRYETLIAAIEKSVKQNMSSWGEWVRDQIAAFRRDQHKGHQG